MAIRKAKWDEVFKGKEIRITFSSDAFPYIRKLLGLKNLKCEYCGKRLNKFNIGGIMKNKKAFCNCLLCIYDSINKLSK